MRRLLPCILSASFLVTGLKAQQIKRPFEISISLGPAFNVGKSGSPGPDSTVLNSYAKTGFNANITLSYHFPNSVWGIFGMMGWQQNAVDSKEFAKSGFSTMPDSATEFVNSDCLNTWKFLAGPVIKLPLGRDGKCSIELGIGGGFLVAMVPDFTINSYHERATEIQYFYGGRLPFTFCYQIISGFNYRISPRCSLAINASYTHSRPEYKVDYEVNDIPFYYTYAYPINSLNLLFGISYSL